MRYVLGKNSVVTNVIEATPAVAAAIANKLSNKEFIEVLGPNTNCWIGWVRSAPGVFAAPSLTQAEQTAKDRQDFITQKKQEALQQLTAITAIVDGGVPTTVSEISNSIFALASAVQFLLEKEK